MKYDSFTFTHNGRDYVAELHFDHCHGAPWEECDGHGPVSDWTTRDKRPGELILNAKNGSYRYYDFQEACEIARRDGWNAPPYVIPGETKRAQAARAALVDYNYLRAWCSDDWHYCGVRVRLENTCECCGDTESLWGIESNCDDYLKEVAAELAEELAEELEARKIAA